MKNIKYRIKLAWAVLVSPNMQWIFIKMTDQTQRDIIENIKPVDIDIRYINVDERVIERLTRNLNKTTQH